MGDPINRYFRGRPFAGTGAAADYFNKPPDLSYLEDDDNGGYPLPEEGGYAVSEIPVQRLPQDRRERAFVARNIARQEGPIPPWLLSQLKQEQGLEAPDEGHAQRRRSDAAWAMHYLNKADPTSPDFSEGVTRMFQQFPGAAQDKNVINQVALIKSNSPQARVHPDSQKLIKDLWTLNEDDSEYHSKAEALIRSAPEHALSDGRVIPYVQSALQKASSSRQRAEGRRLKEADDSDRMVSAMRTDPLASSYYNHLIKNPVNPMPPKEAMRMVQDAHAEAPKNEEDRLDYYEGLKAGGKREELAPKFRDSEWMRSNLTNSRDLDIHDANGSVIPERLKGVQKHVREYGDNPSAAFSRVSSDTYNRGRVNDADAELRSAAAKIAASPYDLIRARMKDPKMTDADIDGMTDGGKDGVIAEAESIKKDQLLSATRSISKLKNAGFKNNEIYNYLSDIGYNPEVLGVKRVPLPYEKQLTEPPQSTEANPKSNIIQVNSKEEWEKLPKGTPFVDSNGKQAIKR